MASGPTASAVAEPNDWATVEPGDWQTVDQAGSKPPLPAKPFAVDPVGISRERYRKTYGQESPVPGLAPQHFLGGSQGMEELAGAANLGLLKPVLTSATGALWKTIGQTAKSTAVRGATGAATGFLTEKAANAIHLPRNVSTAAGILGGLFGAMSPGLISEYLAQERGAVTVGSFLRWWNSGRKTPFPAGKGTAPPKIASGGAGEIGPLSRVRKVKPGWKGPALEVEASPAAPKPVRPNPNIARKLNRTASGSTDPAYRLKLPTKVTPGWKGPVAEEEAPSAAMTAAPKPVGPTPESPVQSSDPRNIGWSRLEAAAKAKDIKMAKRFAGLKLSPEKVSQMSEEEFNTHLKGEGFQPYRGKHLSRTFAAGKADIVKLLKNLNKGE